ncbi:hypothetical protein PsorP6_018753 [Peronosclerospora sorghi]|nr:hypothetical protein PsorP6_018753 [Peronosclerospora sorghi]
MSLPCANATLMKSSLDRLLVLLDALLMIDPIDVDSYNQKVELTTLRHRLVPSYMSFNLILDQGTLRISDYVSIHEETDDTIHGAIGLSCPSRGSKHDVLEQNGRSNPIVPVLYRTPLGVSNAPLLFMGVDITDQTSEMRDMKVEVHVSHIRQVCRMKSVSRF